MPFWTTCECSPGHRPGHVTGRLGCFAAGLLLRQGHHCAVGGVFTDPAAAANVGTPLASRCTRHSCTRRGRAVDSWACCSRPERADEASPAGRLGLHVPVAVSRFIIEFTAAIARHCLRRPVHVAVISVVLGTLSLAMLAWLARLKRDGAAGSADPPQGGLPADGCSGELRRSTQFAKR